MKDEMRTDEDGMNKLMERIEEHIQVAEWCILEILESDGEPVKFSAISMSNVLLATALATVEMIKALNRIEERMDVRKELLQDPGIVREELSKSESVKEVKEVVATTDLDGGGAGEVEVGDELQEWWQKSGGEDGSDEGWID